MISRDGCQPVSAVLPLTSFLAIVALGQVLVIMTGGIDLSVPSVMTLAAMIPVGLDLNRIRTLAYESCDCVIRRARFKLPLL